MFQVVEKESFGVDWHPVRYYDKALTRFNTREDAFKAARDYLTEVNCNNALTSAEKLSNIEAYMDTDDGIYLGELDGKPWYMTYPKDIKDRSGAVFIKGSVVKDKRFFLLDGKAEISVREIRGT